MVRVKSEVEVDGGGGDSDVKGGGINEELIGRAITGICIHLFLRGSKASVLRDSALLSRRSGLHGRLSLLVPVSSSTANVQPTCCRQLCHLGSSQLDAQVDRTRGGRATQAREDRFALIASESKTGERSVNLPLRCKR